MTDVSKMTTVQLDKLSAKIEARRQQLKEQAAVSEMKAVAKKHGVDFAKVTKLHSAKLSTGMKTPTREVRKKTKPSKSVQVSASKTEKAQPSISSAAAAPVPAAAKKTATKSSPQPAQKTAAQRSASMKAKRQSKPAKNKVIKFKNPNNPEQTWSGMGRKPAWVKAHLAAGKDLNGLSA